MRILQVVDAHIPPSLYGGTERIVWWLGQALAARGHEVRFMARSMQDNDFASFQPYDRNRALAEQISGWADVVHLHESAQLNTDIPVVTTIHTNLKPGIQVGQNSVFVSRKQAENHGGTAVVYNGVPPDAYPMQGPSIAGKRPFFHFLGKAAWKVKNIRGAVEITRRAGVALRVLGGTRLNLKMGFRYTPDRHVRFYGMVGGDEKLALMRESSGLLFPVTWHEPFGIALVESLLLGSPVFGTPYGSLPEILTQEVGHLSTSYSELADALGQSGSYSPHLCREYAADRFNASLMANAYISAYETVINGQFLNPQAVKSLNIPFRNLEVTRD